MNYLVYHKWRYILHSTAHLWSKNLSQRILNQINQIISDFSISWNNSISKKDSSTSHLIIFFILFPCCTDSSNGLCSYFVYCYCEGKYLLGWSPISIGLGSDNVWIYDKLSQVKIVWRKKWEKHNYIIRCSLSGFQTKRHAEGSWAAAAVTTSFCAMARGRAGQRPVGLGLLLAETFYGKSEAFQRSSCSLWAEVRGSCGLDLAASSQCPPSWLTGQHQAHLFRVGF